MKWGITIESRQYQIESDKPLDEVIKQATQEYLEWYADMRWGDIGYDIGRSGGTHWMHGMNGQATNDVQETFNFTINGEIVIDIDYGIYGAKTEEVTDPAVLEALALARASNHPDQMTIDEMEKS